MIDLNEIHGADANPIWTVRERLNNNTSHYEQDNTGNRDLRLLLFDWDKKEDYITEGQRVKHIAWHLKPRPELRSSIRIWGPLVEHGYSNLARK